MSSIIRLVYVHQSIKKTKKTKNINQKKNSTRRRGFFGKNTSSTNLSIMPASKEYFQRYYIEHIDEYKERYKKYAKKESYKERVSKYQKKYHQENKDHINKYKQELYKKNQEKNRIKAKAYYQKNKVRLADNRYLLKYADIMAEFVISLDGF
tara:strand:+ start:521 stop:976 length:456 start_codon:yes stop_codon:yes gene_type:complete